MKKVMLVFGTRPDAIKMAPLVNAFESDKAHFKTVVCVTGQHREMLDQVLGIFQITPKYDLNIMKKGQDLYDVTSRILTSLRDVLQKESPDVVLVHGDTTTSMAAALAAFYQQIPVAHVEAGLRTHNILSPWPEEMNRQITARIASYHFAPTVQSRKNLLDEGIRDEQIFITGNTVIDALHYVMRVLNISPKSAPTNKRLVLITGHRRENFGKGLENICKAIRTLAWQFPDVGFIYPMHPNPHVRAAVNDIFGIASNANQAQNIRLIEPLNYLDFVRLMAKATIVLTDSGGIQEEAPAFGKPVLVMRNTTERPEAIEAGTAKLVGADYHKIVCEVSELLNNAEAYMAMSNAVNPYGDGHACDRILEVLK